MNTATTPRIEPAIREHLAPLLRRDGFAGSGRSFRRSVAGWIQVVSVQGSRYGGEFAVNLGIQPICIPDALGHAPDPKTITEERCEFRRRLSESVERLDRWWKHEPAAESMAEAVREAAHTYEKTGRALLNEAIAEGADLNQVGPSAFAAGKFNFLGFASTECRMAFALARLRKAQGRLSEARAFAAHALEHVGAASLLKAQIQAFLKHHDV